ncbi:MAG TPA: DUF1259 domain-containing protein [Acidimicrobiia bacterium]|jgi:hypothetical protein|nr:DUF1259 domain-containing protein [Acidimicrobiia bacterium]
MGRSAQIRRWLPAAILFVVTAVVAGCSDPESEPAQRATGGEESRSSAARPVDWKAVDEALGRGGEAMPGDVHRYGFPRSDLKVTLDGVALQPGFALGSYAAFAPTSDDIVVMGDLVLTEAEVSPVMAKLQRGGFDVTAVHNHLLREQPKIMYMHYLGHGPNPAALARELRAALEASATPSAAPGATSSSGADLGFDPAEIDRILGRTGKPGGGLLKYAIARAEAVEMPLGDNRPTPGGAEAKANPDKSSRLPLTPGLGVATVINFESLGSGRAAITGDFALRGSEVASVTRTLRDQGIEVTAVHTHMTDDEPHLFYVHFFAAGPATDLARGLRTALDETNSSKA